MVVPTCPELGGARLRGRCQDSGSCVPWSQPCSATCEPPSLQYQDRLLGPAQALVSEAALPLPGGGGPARGAGSRPGCLGRGEGLRVCWGAGAVGRTPSQVSVPRSTPSSRNLFLKIVGMWLLTV